MLRILFFFFFLRRFFLRPQETIFLALFSLLLSASISFDAFSKTKKKRKKKKGPSKSQIAEKNIKPIHLDLGPLYVFSPEREGLPFILQKHIKDRTKDFKPPSYPEKGKLQKASASKGISQKGATLIKKHSPLKIEVVSGQTLVLSLEVEKKAANDDIGYIWTKETKVLCTQQECSISTVGWPSGRHLVRTQVFDNHGAQYLTFDIHVAYRQKDEQGTEVRPAMVAASKKIPLFSLESYYVRSLAGLGFKRSLHKTSMIDNYAKHLDFKENLRTDSVGLLRFGLGHVFEHYLFQKSRARLNKTPNNNYQIYLDYGLLRSRMLREGASGPLTILPMKKMQIDTNEKGDVFVYAKKLKGASLEKMVRVFCLRGRCRVSLDRKTYENHMLDENHHLSSLMRENGNLAFTDKDIFFLLAAGEAIEISPKKDKKIAIFPLISPNIADAIYLSTPLYQNIADWPSYVKEEQMPLGLFSTGDGYFYGAAIPLSKKLIFEVKPYLFDLSSALVNRDYFLAIERMSQFPDHYVDLPRFSLLQGALRIWLSDFGAANAFFKDALKHKKAAVLKEEVTFFHGVSHLLSKKYQKAIKLFASIKQQEEMRDERIAYYRGVSRFYLSDYHKAEIQFEKCLWICRTPALRESSALFLQRIDSLSTFFGKTKIRLIYNTNPLHAGKNMTYLKELGYEKKTSDGLGADLSAGFRVDLDEWVLLSLKGKVSMDGYKHIAAAEASRLSAGLYGSLKARLGPPMAPSAQVSIDPFVHRLSRGSSAAVDGFGVKISVGLYWLKKKPHFYLVNSQYLDPSPEADKVLDPLTDEVAGTFDLSGRFFQYGVSLTPYDKDGKRLVGQIEYARHKRRHFSYVAHGYAGPKVLIEYKQKWRQKFLLAGSLGYLARAFLSTRADATMEAKARGDFYYRPMSSFGLFLEYLTNKSTSDVYTYDRIFTGADYGIEF